MAGKTGRAVLFLVPGDPHQRTGGYRYVGHLVTALNGAGVPAEVEGLAGRFPVPDQTAETAMDQALARCDDGACVVLDGLAMGGLPGVVKKHSSRLRLLALVHHPLADETGISQEHREFLFASETRALAAVSQVVTTSRHTALRLQDFQVSPRAIRVVEPGADTVSASVEPERQVPANGELQLLCVASLSPRKAQHQLVQALSELQNLPWHCTLVGSTGRDPEYSKNVTDRISEHGLAGRISLAGELEDDALAEHYRRAHLFVLPSVYEGYGMVIDEAIAAGLPVITTDGGALAGTGNRPGIRQYPAGSADGLRDALQTCLSDRQLLQRMTEDAGRSSQSVRLWSDAAREFERVLDDSPDTRDHSQFDQQWLVLREPADHRARSQTLLARCQDWVNNQVEGSSATLRITDLGAGAGSNGVYLSERLPVRQHWTLLEQNPLLLGEARARLAPKVAGLDPVECTLDVGNLNDRIPPDTRLITASALIDLVSASWLDALADAAQSRKAAVLIVLSYAGEFQLSPGHPDDDWLRAQVNEHQHGDKGSGTALGPDATAYLQEQLEARHFAVALAPSPWVLGAESKRLQGALIQGWCEAALEQCPEERERIGRWQASRQAMAEQGALTVQVNHHDLFAWPTDD
jgi:glycosyltransferase involved in cell wall biosynthesis